MVIKAKIFLLVVVHQFKHSFFLVSSFFGTNKLLLKLQGEEIETESPVHMCRKILLTKLICLSIHNLNGHC